MCVCVHSFFPLKHDSAFLGKPNPQSKTGLANFTSSNQEQRFTQSLFVTVFKQWSVINQVLLQHVDMFTTNTLIQKHDFTLLCNWLYRPILVFLFFPFLIWLNCCVRPEVCKENRKISDQLSTFEFCVFLCKKNDHWHPTCFPILFYTVSLFLYVLSLKIWFIY